MSKNKTDDKKISLYLKELREKITAAFGTRISKKGSYNFGMSLTAIAICVVLIMLVDLLPESVKTFDITNNALYSISEESKEVMDNLENKITLKVIASKDDTDVRIQKLLDNYASYSKNITLTYVDPVVNPSVLNNYSMNSVAVTDEDSGIFYEVPFDDIIVYDEYYYYYYGEYYETEFDGEGQITAAISRVIGGSASVIYLTEGHGESELAETITDRFVKLNISCIQVNLLLNNGIPDDCETLIINAPEYDLAYDERLMLESYIENGGKVIFLASFYDVETPNFEALLNKYGMSEVNGYIADTERYYNQNPYYIFPVLDQTSDICDVGSDLLALVINSKGLSIAQEEDDTFTVSAFMSTSSNGLAVTETDQAPGTYTLAALSEDDESGGKLIVFACPYIIDETLLSSFGNLANADIFINAVSYGSEELTSATAIDAKSLEITYNTVENPAAVSLLITVIVPLCVLICGAVICIKRKRR